MEKPPKEGKGAIALKIAEGRGYPLYQSSVARSLYYQSSGRSLTREGSKAGWSSWLESFPNFKIASLTFQSHSTTISNFSLLFSTRTRSRCERIKRKSCALCGTRFETLR